MDVLFTLLKFLLIMLANHHPKLGHGSVGLHGGKPPIALSHFRHLRSLTSVKLVHVIYRHHYWIDHHSLGGHWVCGYARECYGGRCRIKTLQHHLTEFTAVQCIGKVYMKVTGKVKVLGANETNLLIRYKAYDDITINFFMCTLLFVGVINGKV